MLAPLAPQPLTAGVRQHHHEKGVPGSLGESQRLDCGASRLLLGNCLRAARDRLPGQRGLRCRNGGFRCHGGAFCCVLCDGRGSSRREASTYAGEKFLHSSILLVQTLLIVSVRDAILQLQFVRDHSFLAGQARGLSAVILSFVAIAAVWTWHHGFSELNAALWENWERRIREHNETRRKPPAIDIDVGADAAHRHKAEQNAAPDAREDARG